MFVEHTHTLTFVLSRHSTRKKRSSFSVCYGFCRLVRSVVVVVFTVCLFPLFFLLLFSFCRIDCLIHWSTLFFFFFPNKCSFNISPSSCSSNWIEITESGKTSGSAGGFSRVCVVVQKSPSSFSQLIAPHTTWRAFVFHCRRLFFWFAAAAAALLSLNLSVPCARCWVLCFSKRYGNERNGRD